MAIQLILWGAASMICSKRRPLSFLTKFTQFFAISIRLYIYIYIYNRLIGLVGRVFANGPGDRGSIRSSSHTKDF